MTVASVRHRSASSDASSSTIANKSLYDALGKLSFEAKIVLCGNSNVGKTSIARRFVNRAFNPHAVSTIGASLLTKEVTVGDSSAKLAIWDTAGEERFRSLAPLFFRGARVALLVYDITDRQSFEDIRGWMHDLWRYAGDECELVVLVGNKADRSSERVVSIGEGQQLADSLGAWFYDHEVSALDDQFVSDLFQSVGEKLVAIERVKLFSDRDSQDESRVTLFEFDDGGDASAQRQLFECC